MTVDVFEITEIIWWYGGIVFPCLKKRKMERGRRSQANESIESIEATEGIEATGGIEAIEAIEAKHSRLNYRPHSQPQSQSQAQAQCAICLCSMEIDGLSIIGCKIQQCVSFIYKYLPFT